MEFNFNRDIFERELRSEIEMRRDEIAVQVVHRSGVSCFEDYHHLTGYVAAFEEALQMMDEVRSRLMKKPD